MYRLYGLMVLCVVMALSACVPSSRYQSLYHWGDYEDSLYKRHTDSDESGQAQAFDMLRVTIQEAEAGNRQVPPGVYADYGYLLLTQGKADVAVASFQKEAALYPEAKVLMDTLVSRVEETQ